MYRFLITALIAILSTLGTERLLNSTEPETRLGSTLTTITGTTKVSDLDTILTANFNALNADKIEVSTTTMSLLTSVPNLVTIGTITTGVWNGTGIDVARQGTGTTTLCSNNVLLGNAGSGFKCTNGHGASGEFLTSNGAGVAPTWQASSVSLTNDYAWTGEHSFTSATSTVADITKLTVVSGGTFTLNGTFAQSAASSTVLSRDASGNDSWMPTMFEIASTTLTSAANTMDLQNIPASENLHIIISTRKPGSGSSASMLIYFNNDVGANYNLSLSRNDGTTQINQASTSATDIGLTGKGFGLDAGMFFSIDISNSQQLVKRIVWTGGAVDDTNLDTAPFFFIGSGFWNNTTTRINRITVKLSKNEQMPAGSRITVWGSSN